MYKLRYIFLCIVVASFISNATAQKNHNRTFLSGNYAGFFADSMNYNNVYVERRDTGLHFSKKYYSYYDFFLSQTSTYCDSDGKPVMVWQGCYILDADSLSPIYKGDFSDSKGAKEPQFKFCSLRERTGNYRVINGYNLTYSTFFLDRGDPHNILMVYYRYENIPRLDSFYLYTARIDLTGSPEGKPAVMYKDSLAAGPINLKVGSIQAIRHANGLDWHIVFAENYSSNFYSVLFDREGTHPVVKSVISQWGINTNNSGISAVSPRGDIFAYLSQQENKFILLNFDRCSGAFSFLAQDSFPIIEEGNLWIRFAEFSPSGHYYYITTASNLYQFDLKDPSLHNSLTHIASFDTAQVNQFPIPLPIKGYFGQMFRGYDGHMYMWSGNAVPLIHRIEFPDRKGPDVGFKQDFRKLPFYPPWFINTLVDYELGALPGDPCHTATKDLPPEKITLYPNPTSNRIKSNLSYDYDGLKLSIIDATGRRVYAGSCGDLRSGIDVQSLPSGMYLVLIQGREVGKFAKVN